MNFHAVDCRDVNSRMTSVSERSDSQNSLGGDELRESQLLKCTVIFISVLQSHSTL